MAGVDEGSCSDRREECRDTLFAAVNKRVTWVVFWAIISLLVVIGGGVVGYSLRVATSGAQAVSVQENRAAISQTRDLANENRVCIARMEESISGIAREQTRMSAAQDRQDRKLEEILRELKK